MHLIKVIRESQTFLEDLQINLDSEAGTWSYSNPCSIGNKLAMMKETYGLTINTTRMDLPAEKTIAGKPTSNSPFGL